MRKLDRRKFLAESATALGYISMRPLIAHTSMREDSHAYIRLPKSPIASRQPTSTAPPLYNTNYQAAIGLGDQLAGIVDCQGSLDSRHSKVSIEGPHNPRLGEHATYSQSLADGYLPIITTEMSFGNDVSKWIVYASNANGLEADYIEGLSGSEPLEAKLVFPYSATVSVTDNAVLSEGQVLATFSSASVGAISQAKYNLLTRPRHTMTLTQPPGDLKSLDRAFASGIASFLFRPIEYRFPVTQGRQYHVVLGIIPPAPTSGELTNDPPMPGETLLKWTVGGGSVLVDMADLTAGVPYLHQFAVDAAASYLHVKSETDPSATLCFRPSILNGVWIFDHAIDLEKVKTGLINEEALYYVRCGQEDPEESACSVTLNLAPSTSIDIPRWKVCLPYSMEADGPSDAMMPRGNDGPAAAKQRWEVLLERGARITTGDSQLDNLYRSSIVNLMLLRTRYTNGSGEDFYVVKPGAGIYDAFWYRDGSYMTTALDVAGQLSEAEKSLRMFWRANLPTELGPYEQRMSGAWEAPIDEFDSQGEALWALVHHFQLTGDRAWLRTVYANIRKGARWIQMSTTQTMFTMEQGSRTRYYGLLPIGEGESIAEGLGYYFYLDYWAVFGLRMAIQAATTLNEESDALWMKQACDELVTNLLTAVKQAYATVGDGKYIPATPFEGLPRCDVWGSIAALYPTRFLDADDPMITSTLDLIREFSREDEYTYAGFFHSILWTYMTVDWAMCYLLRDDIVNFHKLFDGYVAHASPTNAWIETISLATRVGAGDMPHGWASAQFIHLLRNSLVMEDNGNLHLCRGAKDGWWQSGMRVDGAPTRFGTIGFRSSGSGNEPLGFEYTIDNRPAQSRAAHIYVHLPKNMSNPTTIRINGVLHDIKPGQSVVELT